MYKMEGNTDLQVLIAKEGLGELIASGSRDNVYRIGNSNYAAKFGRLDYFSHNDQVLGLEKEYRIAKKLHGEGVSVPKPEGVFGVKHPKRDGFFPCFVMEYIPPKKVRWYQKRKVDRMYKHEIQKATELGYSVCDSYPQHNTLWSPKRKKIYLIDFEYWGERQMLLFPNPCD